MARVCVLLADGFEEIEAVTIIDVLRRAEIDVTTVSVSPPPGGSLEVRGAHGIAMRAERSLLDAAEQDWDMVLLPGGMPGATNLRDHPGVQELLRRQHDEGRALGAICAAPIALGSAGVLEGRKATCYPGFEDGLTGADCVTDRVVEDGPLTTSRGPGTAIEFSLAIVARLAGAEVAAQLREGMLVGA
jgi:4-methyl-5(b-hydroxyethyl)-thiazole monophosphate biosynthesis